MKLSSSVAMTAAAATAMPTVTWGYMMGPKIFVRPVTPTTGRGYCSPGSNDDFRQEVNQAFEDLASEFAGSNGAFGEDNLETQRAKVNKAFGFLSELCRDASDNEVDARAGEEMIQKQQKWVNKAMDFAAEWKREFSEDNVAEKTRSDTANPKRNWEPNTTSDSVPSKEPQEVETPARVVTPPYEIQNDESIFQISLDLPGVQLEDIDLAVEPDTELLTIKAERKVLGSDQVIQFAKSIGLDPSVDADQITAKLNNGVLTVSAPKKPKAKSTAKKIPISSNE